jgi:hypothetical protein
MGKSLLGKLAPAAVGMMELPRLGLDVLEGFRALGDLTCFVPYARAAEVLAVAQRFALRERDRLASLKAGMALADWLKH